MANTSPISAAQPIAQILQIAPAARQVFHTWQTACVGCRLAQFCTLSDMAQYYSLDLAQVVVEINAYAAQAAAPPA